MRANDNSIPAADFWAGLQEAGVRVTEEYTANGAARFCKQSDGELFTVSVHDYYPQHMINKVLSENGFFSVPLYNNISK